MSGRRHSVSASCTFLGAVVQSVVRVAAPGPVSRVLYGLRGELGLERNQQGAGLAEVKEGDNQGGHQQAGGGGGGCDSNHYKCRRL